MGFIFDGVEIEGVLFNGTPLDELIFNGEVVWTGQEPIEKLLIDFGYNDNGDGTYTITEWKQTYNGVSSTELIIPDDPRIIL